jgi:hypothetical protein
MILFHLIAILVIFGAGMWFGATYTGREVLAWIDRVRAYVAALGAMALGAFTQAQGWFERAWEAVSTLF